MTYFFLFYGVGVYFKFQQEVDRFFLVVQALHRQPYEDLLIYLSATIRKKLRSSVQWRKVFCSAPPDYEIHELIL